MKTIPIVEKHQKGIKKAPNSIKIDTKSDTPWKYGGLRKCSNFCCCHLISNQNSDQSDFSIRPAVVTLFVGEMCPILTVFFYLYAGLPWITCFQPGWALKLADWILKKNSENCVSHVPIMLPFRGIKRRFGCFFLNFTKTTNLQVFQNTCLFKTEFWENFKTENFIWIVSTEFCFRPLFQNKIVLAKLSTDI